ncbi:hypothetical protein ACFODL_17190 [Phenylobacterium terrae]|uniref:Thioredoxin domain-containing protein n=1 Tax=Phenylobacterium terrae TaxID=2665495 RepID=A0ABW4N4F1_9CAUL
MLIDALAHLPLVQANGDPADLFGSAETVAFLINRPIDSSSGLTSEAQAAIFQANALKAAAAAAGRAIDVVIVSLGSAREVELQAVSQGGVASGVRVVGLEGPLTDWDLQPTPAGLALWEFRTAYLQQTGQTFGDYWGGDTPVAFYRPTATDLQLVPYVSDLTGFQAVIDPASLEAALGGGIDLPAATVPPLNLTTEAGAYDEVGEFVPNLTFVDSFGASKSLLGMTEGLLVLSLAGEWCPPCFQFAAQLPAIAAELGDGFTVVEMLLQNNEVGMARTSDAHAWRERFDLTTPVLTANGDLSLYINLMTGARIEVFPTYIVIDGVTGEILGRLEGHDESFVPTLKAIEEDFLSGLGERISGSAKAESIQGSRFSDTLHGQTGDDRLDAGAGHDSVAGGAGSDSLQGGSGEDTLEGQAGNDSIGGGTGADSIDGGVGNDRLLGGDGDDTLLGQQGDDSLSGGNGDDSLDGGLGRDTLAGGEGDDVYFLANGRIDEDSILEQADGGFDALRLGGQQAQLVIDGALPSHVERLIIDARARPLDVAFEARGPGALSFAFDMDQASLSRLGTISGSRFNDKLIIDLRPIGPPPAAPVAVDGEGGNDTITASGMSFVVDGGAGDDSIASGGGDDRLIGGAGADSLDGGAGSDVYVVDNAGDRILEVDQADGMQFTFMDVALAADFYGMPNVNGEIYLEITRNHDLDLPGGSAFSGLSGPEIIQILTLAWENFSEAYDPATGMISAMTGGGRDRVESSVTFDLASAPDIEDLTLTGASALTGKGNAKDNEIVGNGGNNLLEGRDGDDTLRGGAGKDTLVGGVGYDNLEGGDGADVFRFTPGPAWDEDRILDLGAGDKISLGGQSIVATAAVHLAGNETVSDVELTLAGGARIVLVDVSLATWNQGSGWLLP